MVENVKINNILKYQGHPFHMVSPSTWPILMSICLYTLTTSGALSMHVFEDISTIFFSSLLLIIYTMFLWFRDIINIPIYNVCL